MQAAMLDQQIEAYQALLPSIRAEHGSVWALIADEKLVDTFCAFSDAARYVKAHFPAGKQVLIRHTDERIESAPFVQVRG